MSKPEGKELTQETITLPICFHLHLLLVSSKQTASRDRTSPYITAARENSQQTLLMQTVLNWHRVDLLSMVTLSLLPRSTRRGMLSILSIPTRQLNVSHTVPFTQQHTAAAPSEELSVLQRTSSSSEGLIYHSSPGGKAPTAQV